MTMTMSCFRIHIRKKFSYDVQEEEGATIPSPGTYNNNGWNKELQLQGTPELKTNGYHRCETYQDAVKDVSENSDAGDENCSNGGVIYTQVDKPRLREKEENSNIEDGVRRSIATPEEADQEGCNDGEIYAQVDKPRIARRPSPQPTHEGTYGEQRVNDYNKVRMDDDWQDHGTTALGDGSSEDDASSCGIPSRRQSSQEEEAAHLESGDNFNHQEHSMDMVY